jgi:hypothetical protein
MSIFTNKAKIIKHGKWNCKEISSLDSYSITVKNGATILAGNYVEVIFFYKNSIIPKALRSLDLSQKNPEQKKIVIFGNENAVFQRSLKIIDRKKNEEKKYILKEQFNASWKLAKFQGRSSGWIGNKPGSGGITVDANWLSEPSNLLQQKINERGTDVKTFANSIGRKSSVYSHTSGAREISRDVAIKYAEKLKCDPVDLMFPKKTLPIWSRVNLLKNVELDDNFVPGRLYSYSVEKNDQVVVPRDLYRNDIKAIQIKAKGSMYDNQVAFYYYTENVNKSHINKLCIVGTEIEDFLDGKEVRFYFGLYEEVRGKSNLINPDPFVEGEKKIILKDFEPTFVAPIIALINPEEIVDQTSLEKEIPASEKIRKEEYLMAQLEYFKKNADERTKNFKELKNASKEFVEHTTKTVNDAAVTITLLTKELKELRENIKTDNNLNQEGDFYIPELKIIDKIKKLKVVI